MKPCWEELTLTLEGPACQFFFSFSIGCTIEWNVENLNMLSILKLIIDQGTFLYWPKLWMHSETV